MYDLLSMVLKHGTLCCLHAVCSFILCVRQIALNKLRLKKTWEFLCLVREMRDRNHVAPGITSQRSRAEPRERTSKMLGVGSRQAMIRNVRSVDGYRDKASQRNGTAEAGLVNTLSKSVKIRLADRFASFFHAPIVVCVPFLPQVCTSRICSACLLTINLSYPALPNLADSSAANTTTTWLLQQTSMPTSMNTTTR